MRNIYIYIRIILLEFTIWFVIAYIRKYRNYYIIYIYVMICYHFALSVLLSCSRSPLLERYSSHLCAFPSQRYEVQYQGMVPSLILLSLRSNVQWSLDRQTWDLADMPQGFVAFQLDQPNHLNSKLPCGSLVASHCWVSTVLSMQLRSLNLPPQTPLG